METQDIKSRLLEMADSPEFEETPTGKLMFEAAAEITRLRAEVVRLRDKVDGLESDLAAAVEVAFDRGAYSWVALNYPDQYGKLRARKALEGGE